MHRFGAFERMRSLDECQVAVRSHKADFLSGNERRECVELIRVARYFMSASDIASFTFATSGKNVIKMKLKTNTSLLVLYVCWCFF